MIRIEKLQSLPRKTRLRKIITILQDIEFEIEAGRPADIIYIKGLVQTIQAEKNLASWVYERLKKEIENLTNSEIIRLCSDLRFGLQQYFGIEPADWDMRDRSTGRLLKEKREVYPIHVFLDDIRSPFNVGSIFRTAESFGVEKIILSPATPTPAHKRVQRTAMGCTEILPWEQNDINCCRNADNVFALEVGGIPLSEFQFPSSGIVILGSEELGVSPEGLRLADSSLGRVSIPTGGVKGSMNVSVAFGILLYTWYKNTAVKQ